MSILDRLRAETAEHHQRVEGAVDVMRPDLTRGDWVRVVGRFYGFCAPWESAVEQSARDREIVTLFGDRKKVGWLESDLTELAVGTAERDALPRCARLPALTSAAQLLGSMYVLEGATLGGQVISRHVERTLGLSGGRGYSFFRAYGDRTASMWQSFGQALLALAPELSSDTMVESACETFDRLHNWLVDGPGEPLTCP